MVYLPPILSALSVGILAYLTAEKLMEFKLQKRDTTVQLPLMFKIFLPMIPQFLPFVQRPTLAPTITACEVKLTQAGLDQEFTGEEFVCLRVIYAIFFFVLGLFFVTLPGTLFAMLGLFTMVFAVIFPQLWLISQIKSRHRSIQRALPNVLDLLTLSVEAGRDFLTALKDVLRHREEDALGFELERVFREVQLGKQRREALKAMGKRVGQPDLMSVVDALVQADELGVSLGAILRILGDQMRQKRFHQAEKLANEAPVKLLFPLMCFIFPAVIIIMLGPILLKSFANFM
jgi:tight adherence protein C